MKYQWKKEGSACFHKSGWHLLLLNQMWLKQFDWIEYDASNKHIAGGGGGRGGDVSIFSYRQQIFYILYLCFLWFLMQE